MPKSRTPPIRHFRSYFPAFFATVGAVLAPGVAQAQAGRAVRDTLPQLVQELVGGETVQPQERGETQITVTGRTRSREDPQTHARLLLEYGITDRLQVALRTPAVDGHADADLRRVIPSVLVALLTEARPVALSARASVGFARGVSPAVEGGLVAARGFGRVQLHGAGSLQRADGEMSASESLAALYDAGALAPVVTLAHGAEGTEAEARWALIPGLFVHVGPTFEVGVGVPVALSGGRTLATARLVVTSEF